MPPAAPQAPAAAPARPINPAQQQNIDKLQADLTGIKAGSTVTSEQRVALQADFLALAKGVTKPSKDSLLKLATDLSAALANKSVSSPYCAVLAKTINVLVNSGNLPSNAGPVLRDDRPKFPQSLRRERSQARTRG